METLMALSTAAPVTGVNAADVAGTVAGAAPGGHDLSLDRKSVV